jgi:hypothetical protein
MAVTMGYELNHPHDGQTVPQGTNLTLCSGHRQVRVLTLPAFCGERSLRQEWDYVFRGRGEDDIVIWLPWDEDR